MAVLHIVQSDSRRNNDERKNSSSNPTLGELVLELEPLNLSIQQRKVVISLLVRALEPVQKKRFLDREWIANKRQKLRKNKEHVGPTVVPTVVPTVDRHPETSVESTTVSTDSQFVEKNALSKEERKKERKEEKRERPARGRARTPLPETFILPYPWLLEARQQGLSEEEAELEAKKFTLYWVGNGKPMANWKATWNRWVLQAIEYRRQRQTVKLISVPAASTIRDRQQERSDHAFEAIRRANREDQAREAGCREADGFLPPYHG